MDILMNIDDCGGGRLWVLVAQKVGSNDIDP
jgi:hypothetical protein